VTPSGAAIHRNPVVIADNTIVFRLCRLAQWAAPIFCTKGYESISWVGTSGFRLCC
jgi:hypothetical protein